MVTEPPMNLQRTNLRTCLLLALIPFLGLIATAQTKAQTTKPATKSKAASAPASKAYSPELVQKGSAVFRRDCSFCHGRDAGGGESGPDLTRSKLVTADVNGNQIAPV